MKRRKLFSLVFYWTKQLLWMLCSVQIVGASPDNIAVHAHISTSSDLSQDFVAMGAIDGMIGLDGMGEWACKGETVFWGYIKYPWLKLEWQQQKSIDKILLYDRSSEHEHTAGGTLFFSDGSEVVVTAIPNDGTAKMVTFAPKKVDWVKFQITDGDGVNLGLSEIEVFPAADSYRDHVEWVDPFIETARGRYFFFTPGSTPFGMIAAAPHTRIKNQWGGGYNYNSTDILGFGQLHGWMMSGLDVMPTTGGVNPVKGRQMWKSSFSHDDEIAQPGYHRVYLRKYKMWVENTATERVSFYKMHFTESNHAAILTNLGGYMGSTTMTKAEVTKKSNSEFEGSFVSAGRMWGGPNEIKVFFVVQFDKPFESFDGWVDSINLENITQLTGPSTMSRMDSMTYGSITQSYWNAPSAGVVCNYQVDPGEQIQMKIAISFTSTDNARANLEKECNHWDFDKVREDTRATWNDWLGKIEVKGGTVDQKVKFYTDLWHVLLGRQIIDDESGEYPDYTQGERDWNFTDAKMRIKELPRHSDGTIKYHMYNSDALWLTQWNLNILWGLAWPSVLDDFSASMVQYADNGGLLPRGPCVGGYSYIMTGCPATNMIASTFMKDQLTKVDAGHAFSSIVRNHDIGGMMGADDELRFYMNNGWCPDNAGKSIEWYFQDWSAAQMAKKLGKHADYVKYLERAKGWKNLYHPKHRLLFPKKKNGDWLHDDPLAGAGWIEANAWQGTWSLSHDIPALAEMMGGKAILCEQLNHAFEQAAPDDFVFGYGSGYVSYANQPGCSNAHVFNLAGAPWLSQYWVRRVNEQAYGGTTPDRGYGGHDEDQGQMGGVSALMSIGLFSVKGNGSHVPTYEMTSPVFDEIIIHLDPLYYEGEKFIIRVHNNSEENMYIHKAQLNGEDHQAVWFTHETLSKGGLLELWLDDKPNKSWGKVPFPD